MGFWTSIQHCPWCLQVRVQFVYWLVCRVWLHERKTFVIGMPTQYCRLGGHLRPNCSCSAANKAKLSEVAWYHCFGLHVLSQIAMPIDHLAVTSALREEVTYDIVRSFMHQIIEVSVQLFRIWKWLRPYFLGSSDTFIIFIQILEPIYQ